MRKVPIWVTWFYTVYAAIAFWSVVDVATERGTQVNPFGVFVLIVIAYQAYKDDYSFLQWLQGGLCVLQCIAAYVLYLNNAEAMAADPYAGNYQNHLVSAAVFGAMWLIVRVVGKKEKRDSLVPPVEDESDRINSSEQTTLANNPTITANLNTRDQTNESFSGDLSEISEEVFVAQLKLFEQGVIDEQAWAKILILENGNKEKAKWKYLQSKVKDANEHASQ